MEKTDLGNGLFRYSIEMFGSNYRMDFATDQEFEDWLKPKLIKYKVDTFELKIYKYLLGINTLENKVTTNEEDITAIEEALPNLVTRIKALEAFHS